MLAVGSEKVSLQLLVHHAATTNQDAAQQQQQQQQKLLKQHFYLGRFTSSLVLVVNLKGIIELSGG